MEQSPLPIGTIALTGRRFSLGADERRRHCAIFGKSGTGKTTLLRNMIALDIHAGAGVSVLDPHGDLVRDLVSMIPKARTNDVIYFNPQAQRVPGINIIESVESDQRPLVVSALVSVMKNIWPLGWGPRTEMILSNCAFALLMQPNPTTLLAIPKLLTDPHYRQQILTHVTDPAVRWFFQTYEAWPARFREEAIAAPLNKLDKFLANPLLRAVLGQPVGLDFRALLDAGQILLCDLSKGNLGEDVSSLLGSLIATKLYLAALSRQNIPEPQRRLHLLYADEVHNFVLGIPLEAMLAEARKYRLALILASQTIQQLPDKSAGAVFGNCGTVLCFRVSGDDARRLTREFGVSHEDARTAARSFGTIMPASEIQDLPDFHAYIRTLIAGQPQGPHHVQTFPPFDRTSLNTTDPDQLIELSLARYGKPRADVEATLNRFLLA